ncbi:AAA ATPase-like protein [Mucilaginibacter oryzae]|uniref:AAA ATPase-like protein n=1 Tax=Mucilaginibacter oryzae TaxID=468058 RepID=A0A316H7Z9_9SPHI|nr:AAA family ATPase [Mucilaginibacter oryzae]PWK76568.1 AAA ATPase-like protein [Mucilaginibacter oryzae]
MKRITKLEISNFRAFFDNYTIELGKGENLIIYGENGSGKSSLFKSLSNFLSSSQNKVFPYVKHHSKSGEDGILSFTFSDYDFLTNTITSPFGEIINFGSNVISTDTEQFIKTAELTKGFLDYKGLLAVYNHDEPQPNLFNLIVLNLFKDFLPTHLGGTRQLGSRFIYLRNEIATAYNTRTWQYRNAVPEMAVYESLLRRVLNEVFIQLNYLLIKYFKLNLRVWYSLAPLVSTSWWREIPTELKLELKLNGTLVRHQSDILNEARLSALAICLYLAVIKKNPQQIDLKILFLDDVFIGLDLTNRLPILDIIRNEFSDYQVFISTYDRHLYELAKRKFETETPDRWKAIELYVGKDNIDGQLIDRPVLIVGESHFEKASRYLHDIRKPDYPAAANYFRKALEQLIQDFIPKWETADAENAQIPDYQLTQLILRAKRFLANAGLSTEHVDKIYTLLTSLLHPLSHHEITSPVYRGELFIIENSFQKLRELLLDLDIPNNYKCCLEQGKRLKITFEINAAANHYCYYELILKSPLTMKHNGALLPIISEVHCVADRCYGHNGATPYPAFNPDKKESEFNYGSLQNAYDRIHTFLIGRATIGAFPKAVDYLTTIEYHDGTNWQPLKNKIVW